MLIQNQTSFMFNSRMLPLWLWGIFIFSLLPWGQKLITQVCQRICWELLPTGIKRHCFCSHNYRVMKIFTDNSFLSFPPPGKKYIAINKYLRSITDLEDLGALYILWLKLNSVSFLQKVLIRIIFNRQNGNEKLFIMSLPTDQNNIFIWFSL